MLDLDGTLTDPYDGISRCVAHALSGLGIAALSRDVLCSFIGPPLQESFAALGLPEAAVVAAVGRYRERFTDVGLYENRLYEGIPEALAALRSARHRLAVATSKPTVFAERIVEHFGLAQHLDLVVGATLDGSRRQKADVIGVALQELAVLPANAVMVGDREQDVRGARAHGMRSIGVRWGYAAEGELEGAGADELVCSPAELTQALLGWK